MADDRHRDRDLAALRREYSIGGLSESDLAPEPIAMFRRWLHDVTVAGNHIINPRKHGIAVIGRGEQRLAIYDNRLSGGSFGLLVNNAYGAHISTSRPPAE